MSSPFLSAEPLETPKPEPEPEPQQQAPEFRLPSELEPVMMVYQKVVENPRSINNLWNFTQTFLTFLESKTGVVVPIIKELYPDSTEENILLLLKEVSMKNIPWSIHNCFVTLSNIGTTLAQKEPKDDKDRFFLLYVMLSVNEDSPTYSFTELLQTLQQQDNALYEQLNTKFMEAFSKYEKPASTKTFCMDNIDMKWVWIVVAIVLLLLIGGGCFYYYRCSDKTEFNIADDVSIVSFASG